MFLFTPNDVAGTAPVYLCSGDLTAELLDAQSVQGFIKVGVPVISLSSADAGWLTDQLVPPVSLAPRTVTPHIDGGTPQTQLFIDAFDGGDSTTTAFDGNAIDGSA